MKKILPILLIFVFSSVSPSYALNPVTHESINEHIGKNNINGFSLDAYLRDQLKIPGGIDDGFNSEGVTLKAWQWLRAGGEYEDAPPELLVPYQRSVNHYINPLGSPKGLSGSALTTYFNFFLGNGYKGQFFSLSEWMMRTQNTQNIGGNYSWDDVKDCYLKALTSPSADDRNKYFALTFRGLGQLMHLVQDASVPSHTRNDVHLLYNYEDWVSNNAKISNYAANPVFSGTSFSDVSKLIDTGTYKGYNPNATVNKGIGLSEYTNANFFSEHTITSGSFPYPSIAENTRVVTRDILVKSLFGLVTTPHPRQYYIKTANSRNEWNGESKNGNGYLLSTVDFLKDYRVRYLTYNQPIAPLLDDKVYEDNASLLLPRAVGYSSQVLKYFFRGQINMVNTSGQYYIENNSDEAMNGIFSLYYDDINGNRNKITSWDLSINANSKTIDPVTFTEPTDPAPKESGKYILVFQGKLGNEDNSVVGKMVDIGGVWEDWEAGLTGRHDWSKLIYFSPDGSWWGPSTKTSSFEVVQGIGENSSKVLRVYDQGEMHYGFNQTGWLRTPLTQALPIPKTISFDYNVKSLGNSEFDFIVLLFCDEINGMDYCRNIHLFNPYPWFSTGCDQYGCNSVVERNKWVHVQYDVPASWQGSFFKEINAVRLFFFGHDDLHTPVEVYIDNIDFH